MRYTSIFLFVLFFSQIVNAHSQRCHTDEYIEFRKQQDPEYAKLLEQAEMIIHNHIQSGLRQGNDVYRIPVVVHVVYNTGIQNISDAQIQSQIDVLNEDFRRLNTDASNTPIDFQSVGADTGIEFCLAQTDPDGNPTSGITRTQTSQNSFGLNDAIKYSSQGGKDGWPPQQYLNIWVCNLNFVLGYAELPTANPGPSDGVVIGYRYFGRVGTLDNTYNKGRTTTHEVGHWLGLLHIWGDGGCGVDDNISDTPLQGQPYYGCPNHPQTSCGSTDMFMNYMDYTDDVCMNIFTLGQRNRMRTVLTTLRSSILSSPGCNFQVDNDIDVGIDKISVPGAGKQYCASRLYPVFTFTNYGSINITDVLVEYQIDNDPVKTYNWTGNLSTFQSVEVYLPLENFSAGSHDLTITLKNPNGFIDQNSANNAMNVSFSVVNVGSVEQIPFIEGFEDTAFPPSGWSFSHPGAGFQWERTDSVGGFNQSASSALFDSFSGTNQDNPGGKAKSLISPAVSLAHTYFPKLEFDIAYARFDNTFFEGFEVAYSLDCGTSWEVIYDKQGLGLSTTSDKGDPFFPQSNAEWRKETISLNSLNGINHVTFKFTVKSGWGNNLFLDNINITQTPVSVKEIAEEVVNIHLYPNPGRDLVNIRFENLKETANTRISIIDLLGREVYSSKPGNINTHMINIGSIANGFYYFVFEVNGKIQTKKFIKQ